MKAEATKKSTVTTILPWKPVRKLIIPLRVDDSSTTDFEDDTYELSELEKNNEEALRAFDNASPASIAMDSPSMAPCSPIDGENSLPASNDVNDELVKDSTNTTDTFQVKLDEYLKQVRAKTDSTQEVLSANGSAAKANPQPAVTAQTEKKTIISLKQKTPVVGSVNCPLQLFLFQFICFP